jgi:hypothetical protein
LSPIKRFFLIVWLLAPAATLLADGATDALIHVRVEVDYGPKANPTLVKTVALKPGSSVVDATRAVAEVLQGVVCCDPRDVLAIGGVQCDPQNKSWWIYDLNGSKGPVSAFRCLVVEGDRITWRYQVVKGAAAKKNLSCPLPALK